MGKKLFVYAQSGPGVGYGHLSRCARLARAFEEFEITFFSNDAGAGAYLAAQGIKGFVQVKGVADLPLGCDLLVYDTYVIDEATHRLLDARFNALVRFDDTPAPKRYGNEVIISSLCREFSDGHILAGRSYFLTDRRHFTHTINDTAERIILTIGASDDAGNMLRLVQNLPFTVIPVIGPYFSEADRAAIKRHCPEVIEGATDLLPFFSRADIIITAAGQTLHEAAAIGVPPVVLTVSADQLNNIACYKDTGLLYAGDIEDKDIFEKISRCVDSLRSKKEREDYAFAFKKGVAGSGASKIKEAVTRILFA